MADEMTTQTKPKPKLWDGALKMVKGENTTQLIEQFTAEMTLVAEGLCEDQNKLRKDKPLMKNHPYLLQVQIAWLRSGGWHGL